jgi:protease IV
MSEVHDPFSAPPPPPRPPLTVIPVQQMAPPPPPRPQGSLLGGLFRGLFMMMFMGSLVINFVLFVILILSNMSDGGSSGGMYERFQSGDKKSHNKIAIVKVDGVIMEGLTGFARKEIEEAVKDDAVKAVVLRVNSPGGSITASDDLYRRIKQLRDGTTPNHTGTRKPVVVSMGALAASGGYYISMPGQFIVAEPTTITGSIGVYASFPNIAGLATKYGFGMNVIKAGEVKDSGSMFKEMSPEEHELWQDMVNHAFGQFIEIVEEGRPKLKGKMREDITAETHPIMKKDDEGHEKPLMKKGKDGKEEPVMYTRKRADGGIFTADKALKYGLVDKVGYLEDAITEAATRANLGSDYRAVRYERPPTLMDVLMRGQAKSAGQVDATGLANAATPRLWYLAPQSEMAGIIAAAGRE